MLRLDSRGRQRIWDAGDDEGEDWAIEGCQKWEAPGLTPGMDVHGVCLDWAIHEQSKRWICSRQ
jgi:hypothetical protein